MNVKLLTEHHLEFLSLKGGCTGSSESTLVKMPHCWKSHVTAQILVFLFRNLGMGSAPLNLGKLSVNSEHWEICFEKQLGKIIFFKK